MDFEDEVVGAEQNNLSNLNAQKGIISEQKKNIINLIQKNTALQEELEEIRVDLNRYQTDITDLNTINKNMMTSFETITQEKESYLVNLKKLEYDYACLRQVHYNKNQLKKRKYLKKPNPNYSPVEKEKMIRKETDYEVPLQSVVARLLSSEILKRIQELNHRRGKQKRADVIRDNQDNAKKRSGAQEVSSSILGQVVTLTTSTPVGSTDPIILL
ncbi:hypothetical protein JTB14_025947 [Gonioctena quinquepunctata]|nr:hypothetical protein JTB14_025947 [Gonioctena quinquepunctata]